MRIAVLRIAVIITTTREVGVQLARIFRSDLTRFERVFRKYLHICQGCQRQRGEQSSAIDTTVRDPPPDHSCTLKPELFRLLLFFALLHQICFDGFKEPNDIAANLNVEGKLWKLPTETSDRLQSMQRLNSQWKASEKFINYTCNARNAEFGSSQHTMFTHVTQDRRGHPGYRAVQLRHTSHQ